METVLRREILVNRTLCRIFAVLSFVSLISLGAFVRIPLPFTPVPLTLQTFFVLLSGAFLGRGLGSITQITYISLGVLGLPIFSGASSGLSYLAGPTAGYLFGFILSVLFLGYYIRSVKYSFISLFSLFCLADGILLFSGAIWLKLILGGDINNYLMIGVLPFIPGDLIKAGLAAALYLRLNPRIQSVI